MKNTIQLEFDTNDFAWIMYDNLPTQVQIVSWSVESGHGHRLDITYLVRIPSCRYDGRYRYPDYKLYATKEELIKSLL